MAFTSCPASSTHSSCTQQLPGESCLWADSLKPNKALAQPDPLCLCPTSMSFPVFWIGFWEVRSAELELQPCSVRRCCWKGGCGCSSSCFLLCPPAVPLSPVPGPADAAENLQLPQNHSSGCRNSPQMSPRHIRCPQEGPHCSGEMFSAVWGG